MTTLGTKQHERPYGIRRCRRRGIGDERNATDGTGIRFTERPLERQRNDFNRLGESLHLEHDRRRNRRPGWSGVGNLGGDVDLTTRGDVTKPCRNIHWVADVVITLQQNDLPHRRSTSHRQLGLRCLHGMFDVQQGGEQRR